MADHAPSKKLVLDSSQKEFDPADAQPRPEARSPVTPDDPGALVGDDATATFDSGPSNPTDRASSEALTAATAPAGERAAGIEQDMRELHSEDADPDVDRDIQQP